MMNKLTSIISSQMYVNQQVQITTKSIVANYIKANMSTMNTQHTLDSCQINLPSFCNDLLIQSLNCANRILTQKVKLHFFYKLNKRFFI